MIVLYGQAAPIVIHDSYGVIHDSYGQATIDFAAHRDSVMFPGGCVSVSWALEGIKSVYVNGHGSVGQGEKELCTVGERPTLRVEFLDGETRDYILPIEHRYQNPVIAGLLLVWMAAITTIVYLFLGAPATLITLTIMIFAPMLRVQVSLARDFVDHNMFASILATNPDALLPHFLYHVTVVGLVRIIPFLSIDNASFLVMVAAYGGAALATYWLVRWLVTFKNEAAWQPMLGAGLTLGLMLLGPISFVSDSFNPAEYSSLIYPNTYHNPTIAFLKPLALFVFLLLAKGITDARFQTGSTAVLLAGLTAAATLAKPNFTIELLPALLLLVPYHYWRTRLFGWRWITGAIVLPAGLVLGWQYWFLAQSQSPSALLNADTTFVFAPFHLYVNAWDIPAYWLLPELMLSLLFPLAVYALYWRQARHMRVLNLAWIILLVALAQTYFFVEAPVASNGNLTWGAQIALFIVFAVSAGVLWRMVTETQNKNRGWDWRFMLCGIIFGAHLINRLLVLIQA